MSDSVIPTSSRSQAGAAAPKGPGGRLFYGILKFIGWLILGLLGNILIEWLCMSLLWPGQGVTRSLAMLEAEIGYLEEDLQENVLTDDPSGFAAQVADTLNYGLFRFTRLERVAMVARGQVRQTDQSGRFGNIARDMASGAGKYILAAMVATHVFALRLSVLILSLPVYVLAGMVGAIDGMVQRDINRWSGGRELGQRYHLAKGLVGPGLAMPWIVYLAWPTTVHPYVIILPFALMFGLAVAVTAATFKKYF